MSGNAGPVVLEREPQAAARTVDDDLDERVAAAAVLNGVAAELARRRDDLRLIDEAEAELDGALPDGLARR